MKYKITVERDGYKKLMEIEIDLEAEEVGAIDNIKFDILNRLREMLVTKEDTAMRENN